MRKHPCVSSEQKQADAGFFCPITCVTNWPVALAVDVYIAVEILSGFYFWPAFSTAPLPLNFTMLLNIDISFDLLSYTWDEIPAAMDPIWYGTFLDPDTMSLYSMDTLAVKLKL